MKIRIFAANPKLKEAVRDFENLTEAINRHIVGSEFDAIVDSEIEEELNYFDSSEDFIESLGKKRNSRDNDSFIMSGDGLKEEITPKVLDVLRHDGNMLGYTLLWALKNLRSGDTLSVFSKEGDEPFLVGTIEDTSSYARIKKDLLSIIRGQKLRDAVVVPGYYVEGDEITSRFIDDIFE